MGVNILQMLVKKSTYHIPSSEFKQSLFGDINTNIRYFMVIITLQ